MSSFRLIPAFLLFGLLFLTACDMGASSTAATSTNYVLPPTPGGRLCASQCREARDYCQQDCSLDQRRCVGNVQALAMQDYDKYTRTQFASHAPIELRPRDFEHDEPCDLGVKSCMSECDNPYRECYQSCGGTIETTTSCQFFCF